MTSLHFHNSKKSFRPYYFSFFIEMNRSCTVPFLAKWNAESMSVCSTKGPFCDDVTFCLVQNYAKPIADLGDEKPTT